jgi:hypothetical protein
VTGDDAAPVEQLRVDLHQLREVYAASRSDNAAVRQENVALAADRVELVDQQTAFAEVLRAIASTPSPEHAPGRRVLECR